LAEQTWKEVYTTKTLHSRLSTEWEDWEPVDTKLTDPVQTHWLDDEEVDKLEELRKNKGSNEKDWWKKEGKEGEEG
jgi:hypothetical protein